MFNQKRIFITIVAGLLLMNQGALANDRSISSATLVAESPSCVSSLVSVGVIGFADGMSAVVSEVQKAEYALRKRQDLKAKQDQIQKFYRDDMSNFISLAADTCAPAYQNARAYVLSNVKKIDSALTDGVVDSAILPTSRPAVAGTAR